MSGANERADVKSTIPKYLIGVALVVMCSLIASAVANIANTSGGNDASGIVNKGFELGGIKVGTVTPPEHSGKGGSFDPSSTSKLAVSGTDGAYTEIKYKNKTNHTEATLPHEISQYVDGNVPEGTEITLVAEPTSANGLEFNCWAIVDDDGNIIEVISNNLNADYVMPKGDVNIQAIYKEHILANVPEDNSITIGQVPGRGTANVSIRQGTPLAVVAASDSGAEASYSVTFRNNDKVLYGAETSKKEANGESYSESDNGVTANVSTLDSSASSGRYTINVATNTGATPQNLNVLQYDKQGNCTKIDVPIYYSNVDSDLTIYDANGQAVDMANVKGPYAISYDSGRDLDIDIQLDLENYSYVVNADCIGN